MINLFVRVAVGAATLGLVAAIGYWILEGDRAGADLLLAAVVATALLAAVALAVDVAPPVAPDAPAPDRQPGYSTEDTVASSPWPLLFGLSITGAAVGGARGSWFVVGVAVAAATALGWLGQVWREHPAWTPRVRQRVDDRLIAPLAIPIATFVVAVVIAISMSRVLLAISPTASWVVALLVAAGLLVVLWVIASRPQLRPSALFGLAGLGVAAMAGAGVVGAAAGEREFHPHRDHGHLAHISAEDIAFDKNRLVLPAREDVTVEFRNEDDVLHNVAFYTSTEPDRKPLFNGEPILREDIAYKFKTPAPGTYAFVCDFHPNMTGTLVTEAER